MSNGGMRNRRQDQNVSFKTLFRRFPFLWRFMRRYALLVVVLLLLELVRQLLVSITPLMITYIVDEILPRKDLFSLNVIGAVAVVIYLAASATRLTNMYVRAHLGSHILFDIRSSLYNVLLNQSPSFYTGKATGEVTSRMNNDVRAVQFLASEALFNLSGTFLQIFVSLGFLFYLSWKVTTLIIGLTLVMYVAVSINMFIHKKFRKRLTERWGKLLGFLQEILSNIKIVKAFTAETREAIRHLNKSREIIGINIKLGIVGRMFWVIGTLFGNLIILSAILYGIYLIGRGEVTVGLIFAFVIYINNFLMPIFGLSGTVTQIVSSLVSVDRISLYMETPNEVVSKPSAVKPDAGRGEYAFQGVRFSYSRDDTHALDGVDLVISDGESVAFVGHSGAGKSTTINLILRYYDPTEGRVVYNGRDLRDLDLDAYRERISVVFQDSVLWNDTILNNLRYARHDATLEEMERACRDAAIDDFIEGLPNGYETVVGERGVKVSGGQRQRLCIARAVLKDPDVLLLDEATASVDSISENRIQEALDRIMGRRTTIIIAHRLTTIVHVDRIYVFDAGRIVESGDHTGLLTADGLYAELWRTQMKEREPVV